MAGDVETGGSELQGSELAVVALGEKGEGVGRRNGEVFFVPGAIPGDLIFVKKSEAKHRAQWVSEFALVRASPDRCEPFCSAHLCGGCSLRVMGVRPAAAHKRQRLVDALSRIAAKRRCGGFV